MGQYNLNLSTRPFPAYRVTNLVIAGLFVILASITAWQMYGYMNYSALAGDIRNDERSARVDSEALGRRLAELEAQLNRPEAAAKLSEIDFLNTLIVRKRFSWTQVFANLENLVPDDVHLTSLRPEILNDHIVMHFEVRGRSIAAVSKFISALEQSPAFESVIVSVEQKTDPQASTDVDVSLTVNYYPDKENQ